MSEPGACVASELKGFFYVELHLRADGRWIGRQSTLWLPWLHVGVVDGARNRVPGALVVLRTEAGEIWYAQTGAYGVNLPLFNPAEGIAIFGAAPGAVASSALPLADQAAALAQGRPLLTSADMTIDENTGGTEILILQPDGELVAQRL